MTEVTFQESEYAYRADIAGGKVLRFPNREDADTYLKAEVKA